MPDPGSGPPRLRDLREAGAAAVYRHRVCISADARGLRMSGGVLAVPREIADKLHESVRQGCAARMVWADCRLLEPDHPLSGLLPERHGSRGPRGPESRRTASSGLWRRLAPWAAALVSAGLGFLVFLHRAS